MEVGPIGQVRTLIVDDHQVVVEGVRYLLQGGREFTVVGQALDAETAIREARQQRPDLIILDLRLHGATTAELCRELAQATGARVVILTAHDEEAPLRACLRAGAAGILLKDIHKTDFVRALREVCAGRLVVDQRLGGDPAGWLRAPRGNRALYGGLTEREYDVLRLLSRGMTSREMADALDISLNTARSYVQSVLEKLGARNRIQALARAAELGLL